MPRYAFVEIRGKAINHKTTKEFKAGMIDSAKNAEYQHFYNTDFKSFEEAQGWYKDKIHLDSEQFESSSERKDFLENKITLTGRESRNLALLEYESNSDGLTITKIAPIFKTTAESQKEKGDLEFLDVPKSNSSKSNIHNLNLMSEKLIKEKLTIVEKLEEYQEKVKSPEKKEAIVNIKKTIESEFTKLKNEFEGTNLYKDKETGQMDMDSLDQNKIYAFKENINTILKENSAKLGQHNSSFFQIANKIISFCNDIYSMFKNDSKKAESASHPPAKLLDLIKTKGEKVKEEIESKINNEDFVNKV